jgi:hypothetical protein
LGVAERLRRGTKRPVIGDRDERAKRLEIHLALIDQVSQNKRELSLFIGFLDRSV